MTRSRKQTGAVGNFLAVLYPSRGKASFVVAALLLGLSAGPAGAQTLWAITQETGTTPNKMIAINTTTGAGTLISLVTPQVSGPGIPMAMRGTKLYAWDNPLDWLKELNPVTGAVLATVPTGFGPTPGGIGQMAFRSDGMGYIIGPTGTLYSFDITVPSSTPEGNTLASGLAFSAADVLYGLSPDAATLYTVNQTNGATTVVGSTGIAAGFTNNSLSFDAAGNLFAMVHSGVGTPCVLYQVNSATGSATLVGNIGFLNLRSIAFGPPAPTLGVTVSESAGSTNVTEGGATDTYTVVLNTPPTANVTITINPGSQATVTPSTLTFTGANWNVPQTATVTAVDDALVEGSHTGTITHTAASTDTNYNAIIIASVTANITDNDGGPPPPPPPPPAPAPSAPEGTHVGSSSGASGPEGSYGFGARTRRATLSGPFVVSPGQQAVFNVSHRAGGEAMSTTEEDRNVLFTAAFAGFLALAVLIGIRASRST